MSDETNSYKIAGLTVNFAPLGRTAHQAEKFRVPSVLEPDIRFRIKPELVDMYIAKHPELDRDDAFYMLSGIAFYRKLSGFSGVMIHSAAVSAEGRAYLFSGQCGIGKSTHARYWKELYGDRLIILNDDKPAVRIIDGRPVVFGTPWSGKHDISANASAPLSGICFISRGEENAISRLSPQTAAARILDQVQNGVNEAQWDSIMTVIGRIVETTPVYLLKCINDVSAARLSAKTMTGEEL